VREGRLGLGRFQRIVLVEFEGPRRRAIEVDFAPARRPGERAPHPGVAR
jgi:hypothetical protein